MPGMCGLCKHSTYPREPCKALLVLRPVFLLATDGMAG